MELVIAFAVLLAGAVLALRSATAVNPHQAPAPTGTQTTPEAAEAEAIGEEPADEDDAGGVETVSVDAVPASAQAAPEPAASVSAVTPHAPAKSWAAGPIAITEDLKLDDVLIAAEEPEPELNKPAVRLLLAIAGLALAFAAALLIVARGIETLWNKTFGG